MAVGAELTSVVFCRAAICADSDRRCRLDCEFFDENIVVGKPYAKAPPLSAFRQPRYIEGQNPPTSRPRSLIFLCGSLSLPALWAIEEPRWLNPKACQFV